MRVEGECKAAMEGEKEEGPWEGERRRKSRRWEKEPRSLLT